MSSEPAVQFVYLFVLFVVTAVALFWYLREKDDASGSRIGALDDS